MLGYLAYHILFYKKVVSVKSGLFLNLFFLFCLIRFKNLFWSALNMWQIMLNDSWGLFNNYFQTQTDFAVLHHKSTDSDLRTQSQT